MQNIVNALTPASMPKPSTDTNRIVQIVSWIARHEMIPKRPEGNNTFRLGETFAAENQANGIDRKTPKIPPRNDIWSVSTMESK